MKFPVLNLPYHWDTLGHTIPCAIWMTENRFNPIYPHFDPGHPPLFVELLALAFYILGHFPWLSRLIELLFVSLAMYYTYLLGSFLHNQRVGIFATAFLLFSPLFFAQSGIVSFDMPLTAFTVITLYYALRKDVKKYIFWGSCLVLTKGPGVILILSVLSYILIRDFRKKEFFRNVFSHMVPLFAFLSWQLYHKLQTGWWIYFKSIPPYGAKDFLTNVLDIASNSFFSNNFMWLISMFIILSFCFKPINWFRKEWIIFLLTILLNIFCCSHFAFAIGFLPRYTLFVYPLFFIMGAEAIHIIFERQKVKEIALVGIIVLLFISQWHGHRCIETDRGSGAMLESNLEYIDLIKTHREATRYIETNYAEALVLTTWPMNSELKYPWAGYVNKPIKAIRSDTEFFLLSKIDLVYYSPQSHRHKKLLNIMKSLDLVLLKRFEKDNKYTEVYKVNR